MDTRLTPRPTASPPVDPEMSVDKGKQLPAQIGGIRSFSRKVAANAILNQILDNEVRAMQGKDGNE